MCISFVMILSLNDFFNYPPPLFLIALGKRYASIFLILTTFHFVLLTLLPSRIVFLRNIPSMTKNAAK